MVVMPLMPRGSMCGEDAARQGLLTLQQVPDGGVGARVQTVPMHEAAEEVLGVGAALFAHSAGNSLCDCGALSEAILCTLLLDARLECAHGNLGVNDRGHGLQQWDWQMPHCWSEA